MLTIPLELARRYEARLAQQKKWLGSVLTITSGYAITWTVVTRIRYPSQRKPRSLSRNFR
jgi:hypothetical protein